MRTPDENRLAFLDRSAVAYGTIVELAGDDSGAGDDRILSARRRLKRQTWRIFNKEACEKKGADFDLMKIGDWEKYLHKKVGTFLQWKGDERLQEPNGALCNTVQRRIGAILKS